MAVASEDDVFKLCQVLSGTFSASQNARDEAESHLKQITGTTGLPTILLAVVRHSQVEQNIRLAAAIYLKNEIRRHWQAPEDGFGFRLTDADSVVSVVSPPAESTKPTIYADADKQVVRDSLFEVLVDVCEMAPVRNTVEECIRQVALFDYPEKWPQILEVIFGNLNNIDNVGEARVFCSLVALRRLTAKYELDTRGDRQHLYAIISRTFPLVLKLASALSNEWVQSTSKAFMMKLICKIYWSSTQMALAKSGEVASSLDLWMELMFHIISAQIPPVVVISAGEDEESRANLEQFKVKKRGLQIVHRFFSRYGTDKDEYKEFGRRFIDNWSCHFLEAQLEVLRKNQQDSQSWWVSKRMKSLMIQYLSQSLEISKTYKFMKKDCDQILQEICFPLMSYTEEDEEQWDLDPVDYVRSQNDPFSSFSNPREAATEFVQTLARLRSRDFLNTMQSIVSVCLDAYDNHPVPKPRHLCLQKDGALHLVGSIANRLASEKRKMPIASFLVRHVFPEFDSPSKFLRLRASWTAERLLFPTGSNFFSTNRRLQQVPVFDKEEDLIAAFHKMLQACSDPELPVRIQAGTSIKAFFILSEELESKVLSKAISASLGDIVMKLFSLMSDMDNEWVVGTLQSLVENFEDEVFPYAAELTETLVAALMRLLSDEQAAEEEESLTAAMSIAETIISILSNGGFEAKDDANKAEVICRMENHLLPLLDKMIHPNNQDFLDDGIRILAYLTSYTPTVSNGLWLLFERLYSAMCGGSSIEGYDLPEIFKHGWAPDYLNQMLPALHNFISRDPQQIASKRSAASGKFYLQLVLEMANKALDNNGDPDGPKHGLELIALMFGAFLGQPVINEYMKPSLEVQFGFLKKGEFAKSTRGVLLRVWCTMMLYNVEKLLSMLEEAKKTEEFFAQFHNIDELKSVEGKKIFILAFSKLLEFAMISPQLVPSVVKMHVREIALQVATQQTEIMKLRRKLEDESSEDDSSASEDSEEDLEEDDDAPQKAQQLLAKLRATAAAQYDDDDDEEDDSYQTEASMEDTRCAAPLDSIDDVLVMRGIITGQLAPLFAEVLGPDKFKVMEADIAEEIRRREETARS